MNPYRPKFLSPWTIDIGIAIGLIVMVCGALYVFGRLADWCTASGFCA